MHLPIEALLAGQAVMHSWERSNLKEVDPWTNSQPLYSRSYTPKAVPALSRERSRSAPICQNGRHPRSLVPRRLWPIL